MTTHPNCISITYHVDFHVIWVSITEIDFYLTIDASECAVEYSGGDSLLPAHPFTASNRVQSTGQTYDSISDILMLLILLHLPKSRKRGREDTGGERAVDEMKGEFGKNSQNRVKKRKKKCKNRNSVE